MFWSLLNSRLQFLLKFSWNFWVFLTICFKMLISFISKSVNNFWDSTHMLIFGKKKKKKGGLNQWSTSKVIPQLLPTCSSYRVPLDMSLPKQVMRILLCSLIILSFTISCSWNPLHSSHFLLSSWKIGPITGKLTIHKKKKKKTAIHEYHCIG